MHKKYAMVATTQLN